MQKRRNIKRITSIFIILAILISVQLGAFAEEPVQQPVQQTELPSTWALEGVQWAAIYGLIPQDMFSKYSSPVTKEEFYTICANLYEKMTGKEITPAAKSPFSDTENTYILKAYAANILTGTGKFEPKKEVSRLEMVSGIYKTIKLAYPDFNFNTKINLTYKDTASIPNSAIDTVKFSVAKEILKGKSSNLLDLLTPCTREELMVYARKAYEYTVYESGKASRGAFWKVSDKDSTVYILGSVHVANPSIYPLSKSILSAFDKSDALVVEADVTKQNEELQYLQQKMMYTDDNTLDKNIPKELYDSFVKAVTPFGIAPEVYNKLKPWSAAMVVQNLQLAQGSYDANLGIDLLFMTKAMGKKPIIEIEGIKFQVDMFDSFSKELQVQYLTGTLQPDSQTQGNELQAIESLMSAWKEGNSGEIAKLVAAEEDNSEVAKEFNAKMWTERNNNMSQKVKAYLADPENKTYFVVVGAGHVVGDGGIISQLGEGYEVQQIK